MKNKISVVIPALNEEKYIETTLFHLKMQKPFEIIVADAHSKDSTVKVAKKYGCRVVEAKPGAASYARNAGANAAKVNIILFIDADTIVFPNLLETIERDFSKDKKIIGWTCPIYAFTNSWKEQVIYNMSNNLVEFLTNYIKKPHAPGICIASRRNAFKKIGGFNENIKVMEDHEFAMSLGKIGKFKFCKDSCVFTSTRRMNEWGGFGLIKKYSKIYIKYFINRNKFYKDASKIEYDVIR